MNAKWDWCDECREFTGVEDAREEQIGYEEQARRVWVISLQCGHDLVTPIRGRLQ